MPRSGGGVGTVQVFSPSPCLLSELTARSLLGAHCTVFSCAPAVPQLVLVVGHLGLGAAPAPSQLLKQEFAGFMLRQSLQATIRATYG